MQNSNINDSNIWTNIKKNIIDYIQHLRINISFKSYINTSALIIECYANFTGKLSGLNAVKVTYSHIQQYGDIP